MFTRALFSGNISVGIAYDLVFGSRFTPNDSVTVVIEDAPGGTVLYSGSTPTDDTGQFQIQRDVHGVDLLAGMHVTVTDDATGFAKDLVLADLSIDTIDPATDVVSGTAPDGTVNLSIYGVPMGQVPATVTGGVWSYDFSPFDITLTTTVSASVNDDDLGDIVALLRDLPLVDHDAPGAVNVRYIARLCAHDWGLHHDVTRNLELCRAHLARLQLADDARRRVRAALDEMQAALRGTPKSPRWRVRSFFGEAFPWHDTVDEREGVRIGHLEGE
jgi:hypothetical protein